MTASALREAQKAAEQRIRRLATNDLSSMADLLDAELIYVHSTGKVHGKAQLVDFLERELHVLGIERRTLTAIEQGGLAFLAFMQLMRAHPVHAPHVSIQARTHVAEVWRRVGDTWRLLHAQSTALADTPTE